MSLRRFRSFAIFLISLVIFKTSALPVSNENPTSDIKVAQIKDNVMLESLKSSQTAVNSSEINSDTPKEGTTVNIKLNSKKDLDAAKKVKEVDENGTPIDTTTSITDPLTIISEEFFLPEGTQANPGNIRSTDPALTTQGATHASSSSSSSDETTVEPVTEPAAWKKYSTIRRKPVRSTNDSVTTKEMFLKAETGQDRITLENIFNNISTDMSSKPLVAQPVTKKITEMLTTLINGDITTSTTTTPSTTELSTTTPEATPDVLTSPSSTSTRPSKADILSSKRAGFLDLSVDTTTQEITTISRVTTFPTSTKSYHTGVQLVNDNIKEELLEEEINNNNKKYNHPYQESIDRLPASNQSTTEDNLSVKPIKRLDIYNSSSKYKPLKKIEVHPAKQFVRDPDDNSWRNESISSLGIVFKPNNTSKPFTQVLKNKTEAEWNNLHEKKNKSEEEAPDLRERLEKIAEIRKSKKKKTDMYGNIFYSDSEEYSNSGEKTNAPITGHSSSSLPDISKVLDDLISTQAPVRPSIETVATVKIPIVPKEVIGEYNVTTETPRVFSAADYYSEDDNEYVRLPEFDIKKFSPSERLKQMVTTPLTTSRTVNNRPLFSERNPTIQYFPPTSRPKVKLEYDKRFNYYNVKNMAESFTTPPAPSETATEEVYKQTVTKKPVAYSHFPSAKKVEYITPEQVPVNEGYSVVNNDNSYNKASYVIKHYRDFPDDISKEEDYDRNLDYLPRITDVAHTKTTQSQPAKEKTKSIPTEEYDYETAFRKDIIHRFVDNFNQNSDRFKVDFPVLFNGSNLGRNYELDERSGVFLPRVFVGASSRSDRRSCEPHCEHVVELSPDYELNYYVPDQEERQEIEPKIVRAPFKLR